MKIISMLIACK